MDRLLTERLKNAVIDMDSDLATETAQEIISRKMNAAEVVVNGLNAGMRVVADKYDRKEVFLPQVLASANAFYAAFELLRPHLTVKVDRPGYKMIIGVVEGDIHDIGKNLIKVMIEAHGYHCIDLGRDVPTDEFLERITVEVPNYVAISSLMTPTLMGMKDLLKGMRELHIREGKKVLVGGGQVTQEFANQIGADFYGVNERDTVIWLKQQENKDVN